MKQFTLYEATLRLSGLIDGEGCFYLGRSTRCHSQDRIDAWVYLGMTHKATVVESAKIMAVLSGDPCRPRAKKASRDLRGYKRRPQWIVATSSKEGTLRLIRALLPYLNTKALEGALTVAFLKRATQKGWYKASNLDYRIVEIVRQLKRGCEEAPAKARRILREVTSNEASEGK